MHAIETGACAEGQEDIKRTVEGLNRVGRASGGVWELPIILEIYSPDVPTLNLIDLPGKHICLYV